MVVVRILLLVFTIVLFFFIVSRSVLLLLLYCVRHSFTQSASSRVRTFHVKSLHTINGKLKKTKVSGSASSDWATQMRCHLLCVCVWVGVQGSSSPPTRCQCGSTYAIELCKWAEGDTHTVCWTMCLCILEAPGGCRMGHDVVLCVCVCNFPEITFGP